jgi:hypothetical protein
MILLRNYVNADSYFIVPKSYCLDFAKSINVYQTLFPNWWAKAKRRDVSSPMLSEVLGRIHT